MTIAEYYKVIIDEKNNQAAIKDALAPTSAQEETLALLLAELNSRSRVAIWRLFAFVVAVCQWLREQFFVKMVADAEIKVLNSDIGTPRWLRRKVLEFQYDASNPQNVEFNPDDFSINYPVVDENLRIVAVCSVGRDSSGSYVLVAKGDAYPYSKLTTLEVNSLSDYISKIQFCHRKVRVETKDPDYLYIEGVYYYDPAYAQVIANYVTRAIQEYVKTLSSGENFGGYVNYNKLLDVIQNVPGIKDVKLAEVALRANATPFASRSPIYKLATNTNDLQLKTVSGYLALEPDTDGNDLETKFTGAVYV